MNYFKLLADVTFAWKVSRSQRAEEHSLPAIRGTKEGSEGVVSRVMEEERRAEMVWNLIFVSSGMSNQIGLMLVFHISHAD